MVAVCACLEGSHRLLNAGKSSYSSNMSHTFRTFLQGKHTANFWKGLTCSQNLE